MQGSIRQTPDNEQREDISMVIEKHRATWNGREVLLHRCAVCWPDGPHAGANNGFIPQGEEIVHAKHCPKAVRPK